MYNEQFLRNNGGDESDLSEDSQNSERLKNPYLREIERRKKWKEKVEKNKHLAEKLFEEAKK